MNFYYYYFFLLQDYLQGDTLPRPTGAQIVKVMQGQETPEFKKIFNSWDDHITVRANQNFVIQYFDTVFVLILVITKKKKEKKTFAFFKKKSFDKNSKRNNIIEFEKIFFNILNSKNFYKANLFFFF